MARSEHDLFTQLIDSLKTAESCAREIGVLRSDRRWAKVADLWKGTMDKIWDLAMKSEMKR